MIKDPTHVVTAPMDAIPYTPHDVDTYNLLNRLIEKGHVHCFVKYRESLFHVKRVWMTQGPYVECHLETDDIVLYIKKGLPLMIYISDSPCTTS